MTKPVCIDLFCGLGGWASGFLAEGYDVFGFDIERHDYGTGGYPGDLVLQDVLTLHGSQFKDARVIVASPPCQEYSYMAMPWSRAKKIAEEYRSGVRDRKQLTALFDACFQIQREACEAAGRHIPMILENVRGAQPWVGRSRWNYGSFHLWGDVPALMPMTFRGVKAPGMNWSDQSKRGQDFTRCAAAGGYKSGGNSAQLWKDREGSHFDGSYGQRKSKNGSWDQTRTNYNSDHSWDIGPIPEIDSAHCDNGLKLPGNNGPRRWEDREVQRLCDATKQPGISGPRNNGKGDRWFQDGAARHGSKSDSRKAASAAIAKIPAPLSRHIARVFKP